MAGKNKQEVVLKLDDLIRDVADYADLSDEVAKKAVYAIFWTMIKALKNKERIELRGLGVFYLYRQKEQKKWSKFIGHYTNPAKTIVKFKPSNHVLYKLEPHKFNDYKQS